MRLVAAIFIATSFAASEPASGATISTKLDFGSNFEITSAFQSGLPSLTLGTSLSGGKRLEAVISREGLDLDTAFIGFERGGTAVSPFRYSTTGGDIIVSFSRPINSFSVRMGDFGADSPDQLSLRAFSGTNGEGPMIASSSARLVTQPTGSFDWGERYLTVKASKLQAGVPDGEGTGAIHSVRMIGGSSEFPHSVFYNDFMISIETPSVAEVGLTKAALSTYTLSDIVAGDAASAIAVASVAAKFGLPLCPLATADPTGVAFGTCTVSIAAIGTAAFLNGKAFVDTVEIIKDPPRFDYQELAELHNTSNRPSIVPDGLPEHEQRALHVLFDGFSKSRHLYEAWLITLERFQGAEIDGNAEAMERQLQHLENIIQEVNVVTGQNMANIAHWGVRIDAEFGEQLNDATVREAAADLRTNGLPTFLKQGFSAMGYGESAIEQVERALSSPIPENSIRFSGVGESILSNAQSLQRNISCTSKGCFLDHRLIAAPSDVFELTLEYFNFGDDALVDIFVGGTFLERTTLFTSDEFGPNFLSRTLKASDFGGDLLSVSLFATGQSPLSIGRILVGSHEIGEPSVVPLPSSTLLLLSGFLLAGSFRAFSRRDVGNEFSP